MNIGLISYWGFGRGRANVTLNFVKMLDDKHKAFILKQGKNLIENDFKTVDVNVTEIPDYAVDPEVFRTWVTTNKLDIVVLNEYSQWQDEGGHLIKICKELKVKVFGYLVLEKWDYNKDYKEYDRLISHSKTFQRFCRMAKVRHHSFVPFSIDLKEFPNRKDNPFELPPTTKFRFFHPGGFGGVGERKNTRVVIEAFKKLNTDNTELVITSQKSLTELKIDLPDNIIIIDKNLTRKELIEEYYKSDCTILPSKWETIGIPILESLAAGVPVITNDIPPMNEFVQDNVNGLLCTYHINTYDGISVGVAETNVLSLVTKMKTILNPLIHQVLGKKARQIIEDEYDLEKNKKYLQELLK